MYNRRGFIKALTVIVFGVCLLFIVFAFFAKQFNSGSFAALPTNTTSSMLPQTNPMLDFGNGSSLDSGTTRSIPNGSSVKTSAYSNQISLSSGNASYSTQPFQEYVTIRNNGTAPVDITGWTLTNSKGTRPVQSSEYNYVYPVADSATIGQGTQFLNPSAQYSIGDIILQGGDQAIVTTGQPFSQFPFSISTSFRENICDGYLKNYPFEPQLNRMCPYPADDPQIHTVTDECFDYMNSLNRCEDPKRDDKTNFDAETTQCQNFMTARLSYAGCVANHQSDSNFSSNQWRVFLYKNRELWASQRETITLYDKSGHVVDQVTY